MSPARVGHPLSMNQQSLWRHQRLFPDAQTYGMLGIARTRTLPDLEALRRAYRRLLERHEILRCQIVEDATGNALAHPLALQDLSDAELLPFEDACNWSHARLSAFIDERFSCAHQITAATLFHCVLLIASREAVDALAAGSVGYAPASTHGNAGQTVGLLVFTGHHLVIDFLSFPLLLRELHSLHAEEEGAPLEAQDAFLADANAWSLATSQQMFMTKKETGIAAFVERMASPPQPLSFGGDTLRASMPDTGSRERRFVLPASVRETLLRCARDHGVTPYVVMLSLFQVWLHVNCAAADISVATPMHGRERRLFGHTVGYFANVLPVRQRLVAEDSFADLLRRNQAEVREAVRLAAVPFQVLRERARVHELRPGLTALTQVAFVWNVMPAPAHDAWLQLLLVEQRGSPYELALTVYAQDETWTCGLKHDPTCVPAHFVDRCIEQLPTFAARLAELPAVPLGTLGFVQPPAWCCPAGIVPQPAEDLVEQALLLHGRERARVTAVRYADQALTYAELEDTTRRMAIELLRLMPGEGPIGILMERGIDTVLAMVSALRAGITFAPLHPDQAQSWLVEACQGAGLRGVVFSSSQAEVAAGLPVPGLLYARWCERAQGAPLGRLSVVHPFETAYLIHTSGSSGAPKGVAVSRASLHHLIAASRFMFAGEEQHWTLAHHASFDFAIWEVFGPLVHGHTLTVLDEQCIASPNALHETIIRNGITHLGLTPAACRLLAPWLERHGLGRLRTVCIGGSAVDPALASAFAVLGLETWSFYGPTEVTVWATCARIGDGRPGARIGQPFAGLRAYVLDDTLQWVPEHCVGELYLGGPQLAGYLKPGLTAASFLPDPWFAGERMYRTGDRVRYTHAHGLEFIGRADRQVKLNGYRVELDAIAHALSGCEGIEQLACLHLSGQGLCAAYTTVDGQPLPGLRLAAYAREVLPKYMLPVRFVHRVAFPLTRNRKPDMDALSAELSSGLASRDPSRGLDEARWMNEILIVLCAELNVPQVQADKNFHELGATSIILARLHARLSALAATGPELVDLYTFPTARSLARWLAEGENTPAVGPKHAPAKWQGRRPRTLRHGQNLPGKP
ncbi:MULTISPECIES: amino acid adenylation domain-containing protein [Pseudomonas]|uniref:Non-ribosomal peptide synthetase n=1 Tax=Pseudomonas fluorescens TaxID=294 RepID=A0A0N9WNY1_PSEFL|nr:MULTISPECIES: amino acid adenylation domain-containing protein [Pseudomonas]ALI10215.1 non-ribosomal peptide synthetase [Pseudomonas fluorescens]